MATTASNQKIEIKNRWTGKTVYECEAESLRAAVINAVRDLVPLADADLAGAYLADANLAGANFAGADLAGAYLAGAYLTDANLAGANLTGAYLTDAYLTGAHLTGAYLAGAYLTGAYLAGAYLTGAYLTGANLADANLTGAYLAGANGVDPRRTNPLLALLIQPGPIRSFTLVTADGVSPIRSTERVTYEIGATIEEDDYDPDPTNVRGAGLNVATLPWCLQWHEPDQRILIVEHTAEDIVAVPWFSDGRYRVRRLTVVGEFDLDGIV